jgi:2-polyprenyl-3-methyl-5-hydroxy-6-metoxy-1,4-benzoquinol methylase
MDGQFAHDLLPRPNADEQGRQSFLASMRRFLVTELYDGNAIAYRRRQVPAFERREGRPPSTYLDVRSVMQDDPYYRAFSLLNRATQELLWDSVGESTARQLPTLVAASRHVAPAGGTLRLDQSLPMPAYFTQVDIHVMPGSFHTEIADDDIYAGAVYDRGVYLYAYGGLGARNDALGAGTAGCVRAMFPDLAPRRILDMGCGAGMSTHPLHEAFPDAEIHAVDLAAPMLRYAHGRSESMGVPVHYSQQDAAATDFVDGSFDLVVSNLLLHEIPQKWTRRIVAECHRLLSPGGVMIHNDLVGWPEDPFMQFMAEWNAHHNNEPFERGSGTIDWRGACADAGFAPGDVFLKPVEAAYMSEQLAHVGYRGAVRGGNPA